MAARSGSTFQPVANRGQAQGPGPGLNSVQQRNQQQQQQQQIGPGLPPAPVSRTFAPRTQLQQQQQQQKQQPRTGRGVAATTHQQPYHAALDQLTEDQREEVKEAFNLFDLDQDGRIDILEFRTVCKALGFEVPKDELKAALAEYNFGAGANQNQNQNLQQQQQQQRTVGAQQNVGRIKHTITLANFEDFIAPKIVGKDPEEDVRRAFELFDINQTGVLVAEDIRRVADELGERISDEEIQSMIDEFDHDNDGAISLQDFIDICLS